MNVRALLLVLVLAGCSYPDITLLAEPRPPLEMQEVVVLTAPPPDAYTDMARVYAWSSLPVDTPAGYDRAVQKLRERAGSIGANAVIVPKREQIGWPRIRSLWMWPDAKGRHDEDDTRPTELMGRAVYISP